MYDLTRFYKILSDETRIRILMLLKEQKLCVCQLCGIMEETQPKISKHLAKLRDIEIIIDERVEQYIFYSLNVNNSLYVKTLELINEKIDDYEILKKDRKRSINPECYIK